ANGVVTFTDDRAVKENTASNPDTSEGISLASGAVTLTATITDNDGDSASSSIDLGKQVTFLDDGPTLTASGSGPTVSVDESNLTAATNGISGTIHNGQNSATGSFASVFTAVTGADGAADAVHPVHYALSFDPNVGSGLVDAQTGLTVVLVNNAGVIEGHAGVGGPLVFTLSVDANGVVTFTDDRAVKE